MDATPAIALENMRKETPCTEVLWRFTKDMGFMVDGYLTRDADRFYIVYRGTKDATDAITDIRMAMIPTVGRRLPFMAEYPVILSSEELSSALGPDYDVRLTGMRNACKLACKCLADLLCCCCTRDVWVHKGFAKAVSSTHLSLAKQVALLNTSNLPVVVTGHSLGGACAVLHAWASTTPIHAVYTFGQPRVGRASFLRSYIHKGLHADVVPRAPSLFLGYRHPGNHIFFDYDEKAYWNMPLLYRLRSDVTTTWNSLMQGQVALTDNHHTSNYVADALAVKAHSIEEKSFAY